MRLQPRDYAVAAAVASLVVIAGAAVLVPGVTGVFHDDAIYVSTAKALAEGQGYHLINLPGAPPQTKYPILYPLLLSLVWRAGATLAGRVAAMQWLTLISAAAAIALSYLYVVRFAYTSRLVAAGAVALAATAPFLLYISTLTLSEMPFALSVVIALWRIEATAIDARRSSALAEALTGVLAAVPLLLRVTGAPVLLACLAWLLYRRLRARFVVLGAVVALVPWVVWSTTAFGTWQSNRIAGYYTDYAGAWTAVGRPALANVALRNGLWLLDGTIASWLDGWARALEAFGGALTPLFLIGGAMTWVAVGRDALRGRLLGWALAAYAAAILVWPWPPLRFLIPVLPFVVVGSIRAVHRVAASISPAFARGSVAIVCAMLALFNVAAVAATARLNRAHGYPFYLAPPQPASWSQFDATFAWLRANTAPADVVASGLDTMIYIHADRRAFRPFAHRPDVMFYRGTGQPTGSVADLMSTLKAGGARYLVMMPMFGFAEAGSFATLVDQALAMHPEALQVRMTGADPRFRIIEVVAAASESSAATR
jgi:hypothetical protein